LKPLRKVICWQQEALLLCCLLMVFVVFAALRKDSSRSQTLNVFEWCGADGDGPIFFGIKSKMTESQNYIICLDRLNLSSSQLFRVRNRTSHITGEAAAEIDCIMTQLTNQWILRSSQKFRAQRQPATSKLVWRIERSSEFRRSVVSKWG
jgi:hypothetical protein